jgi:hypothetical protein
MLRTDISHVSVNRSRTRSSDVAPTEASYQLTTGERAEQPRCCGRHCPKPRGDRSRGRVLRHDYVQPGMGTLYCASRYCYREQMKRRGLGTAARLLLGGVLGLVGLRGSAVFGEEQHSTVVPSSGGRVACTRGADGVYRFSVTGTSAELARDREKLLLWVKPLHPSAGGWFLQRPPGNGIDAIEATGAWRGTGQIGNVQYPPHNGDTMDITVTAVETAPADRLLGEAGGTPRGQPSGRVVVESRGVIVSLE